MPRVRQAGKALAGLASRRDALRQAASLADADFAALLDAALAELDAAVGAVGDLAAGAAADHGGDPAAEGAAARAERLLLHTAFQQAPVPMFLLEQDGTIRRANVSAAELLGVPAGYATGRPLTAFLDVPSRAAVRSQLAALARTDGPRRTAGRVLTESGPVGAVFTAAAVDLPGEEPLVIVAAIAGEAPGSPPGAGEAITGEAPGPPPGAGEERVPARPRDSAGRKKRGTDHGGDRTHRTDPISPGDADGAVRAMTRRLDLVTAVTRVLLDNAAFSEAVTIRRCARQLAGAGALADWVIVDLDREGQLRRQTVAGPGGSGDAGGGGDGGSGAGGSRPGGSATGGGSGDGSGAGAGARAAVVRDADPAPESLSWRVHNTGSPVLLAHADDDALLGSGPDGKPLLPALGATSLICVPVRDDEARYGTLTLARLPRLGPYGLADLALAEELGSHLGTAIGVSRRFRERSQAAHALQASLLPVRLPVAEGLEFAAAYLAASGLQETGADFYDAFAVAGGWAVAVGDVSGRGQDAAAMTAATRHAIRALTITRAAPSPADVLAAVNEVLLAGEYDDRYVTARLAFLTRAGDQVRVALGGAGHPGPAVLRADGRVEVLATGGRPLGLFAELGPDLRELGLAPGDLVLFYTDGAVSGRSGDLAAFEERLADQLAALAGHPAPEVVRAAQALATDFSGGELRDDVTLLAVRALLPARVTVSRYRGPARRAAGSAGRRAHVSSAATRASARCRAARRSRTG